MRGKCVLFLYNVESFDSLQYFKLHIMNFAITVTASLSSKDELADSMTGVVKVSFFLVGFARSTGD